jgi:hypothetical protein
LALENDCLPRAAAAVTERRVGACFEHGRYEIFFVAAIDQWRLTAQVPGVYIRAGGNQQFNRLWRSAGGEERRASLLVGRANIGTVRDKRFNDGVGIVITISAALKSYG